MKTLLVFIVGVAVGAIALYYYQQQPGVAGPGLVAGHPAPSAQGTADAAVARGRAAAANVSDAVTEKMQEWHLTPNDIRADLAKTGEVARQNTASFRERVADVRIVAMIKAKYVLDRDLSATSIGVESHEGDVTLAGSVTAENFIGKAVALALDTEGVHHVTAKLQVRPPGP